MNRSFKQQYTQEQDLQVGVASNWGYSIFSNNLDTKSKKQIVSHSPKVANITLRQFNEDIPKTDRIRQVQDEIKALHNQRRLMEENQRAAQAAINGLAPQNNQNKIMEWVDQKIREYNQIIQHRHLIKSNNVETKNLVEENKEETAVTEKAPIESMESRIVDWAERKFAQFMNTKDAIPNNKKQTIQTKKTQDKQHSQPQDILKKIQSKKNELLLTPQSDLTSQININREISNLYRLFYSKNQSSAAQDLRKTRSVAAQPAHSLDKHRSDMHIEENTKTMNCFRFLSTHMNNSVSEYHLTGDEKNERKNSNREMSNEFKTNHVINKYKESEYKKYYTTKNKLLKDGFIQLTQGKKQKETQKKLTIKKDINQPFIEKKEIDNYRSMENKIRRNDEALQLWKSKIQDACNNSRVTKKLEQSSKMKQIEQFKAKNELQQREEQLQAIIGNNLHAIGLGQGQNANMFLKEIAQKNRKHEQQKEDIFAELLRKRHNKFNKLWGTKILVKYDSRGQAKQMLKGDPQKRPQGKSETERGCKTSRSINTPLHLRAGEKGANSVQASFMQEQKDDQHYWRMCKNQKINLLLKRR